MLPIELKNKIDKLWHGFWPVSSFKPFAVVELISFMIYIKRLDEVQTLKEDNELPTDESIENPIYTIEEAEFRWSRFKDLDPESLYHLFTKENGVFNFTWNYAAKDNGFGKFLIGLNIMVPTSELLAGLVEIISEIDIIQRNKKKGDVYEYLLSKINTTGENWQYPTPRHIVDMMVEIMVPITEEIICDPASGTSGFMVSCARYLKENNSRAFLNDAFNQYFSRDMFLGMEHDRTLILVAAMNMLLHGIEDPQLVQVNTVNGANEYRDLATLIFCNPPFTSTGLSEVVDSNIQQVVNSRKPPLLFLAFILKALKNGGRAAVIIPEEVISGTSAEHLQIRKEIIDNHSLEAVISMPAGVFKPFAEIGTGILIFTKKKSISTDKVWFYNMQSDGLSLDEKRQPFTKTGEDGEMRFPDDYGDIPDLLAKWKTREEDSNTSKSGKHFFITVDKIRSKNYDINIKGYKEFQDEQVNEKPIILENQRNNQDDGLIEGQAAAEIDDEQKYGIDNSATPAASKGISKTFIFLIVLIWIVALAVYFLFIRSNDSDNPPSPLKPNVQVPVKDSTQKKVDTLVVDTTIDNAGEIQVQKLEQDSPRTGILGSYKVISKAYFHDKPDEATRRNAFVIHWNNAYATLYALDDTNGFIYIEFTNHEGQISRGWLKKTDLRKVEE